MGADSTGVCPFKKWNSVRVDQLIYLLFFRKTDGGRVVNRRKQRALRKMLRGIKLR